MIAGCVDQVGEQALNVGRNAWLDAGLPESTPATTVDRQCGSGLQALQFAAQGVMAGGYDLVVACGVESMTRVPLGSNVLSGEQRPMTPAVKQRYDVDQFNQAIGAEMIAKKWGMSRSALDEYSARSHQLAAHATQKGWMREEILPVPIDGATMDADQGIRPESSAEKLATLKPAFEGLELLTAGNSSQISDGAAALMVASREKAEELGLKPLARFVAFTPGRLRPGHDADRPDPGDAQSAAARGPVDRRHRRCSKSTRRSPRCRWRGRKSWASTWID